MVGGLTQGCIRTETILSVMFSYCIVAVSWCKREGAAGLICNHTVLLPT